MWEEAAALLCRSGAEGRPPSTIAACGGGDEDDDGMGGDVDGADDPDATLLDPFTLSNGASVCIAGEDAASTAASRSLSATLAASLISSPSASMKSSTSDNEVSAASFEWLLDATLAAASGRASLKMPDAVFAEIEAPTSSPRGTVGVEERELRLRRAEEKVERRALGEPDGILFASLLR